MPTSSATARATRLVVAGEQHRVEAEARSRRTASAEPAFTVSATTSTPRARPSQPATTAVRPASRGARHRGGQRRRARPAPRRRAARAGRRPRRGPRRCPDAAALQVAEARDRGVAARRPPTRAADRVLARRPRRAPASRRTSSASSPRGRHHVDQGAVAGGHGAGLVEHDRVDAAGGLEDLGAADQDAELGTPAGADHQRGRRGQAQGARARDDQHRDRRGERRRRLGPRAEPEAEGGHRERDHRRARRRRRSGRRAAAPGSCRAVPPRPSGPSAPAGCRCPTRVARTTSRPQAFTVAPATDVPGADLDRHRLAGQHRGVDAPTCRSRRRRRSRPSPPGGPRTGPRPPGRPRAPAPRRRRAGPSTSLAPRSSSARSAEPARRLDRFSNQRPASRNVVTPAAASR